MPDVEKLQGIKRNHEVVKNKIEGILKPVAEPYPKLVNPERIKNATYEIPAGLTEKEAMIFTLGAIYSDDILKTMTTSSSAGGKSWESFTAVYVLENVFASEEEANRLKNIPEKMGEGRERIAQIFKNYGEDQEALRNMGRNVLKRISENIIGKRCEGSTNSAAYGIIANMAYDLMTNPSLGLGDVLNEDEKQQLRAFARAYQMEQEAVDAELQLVETLPEKNSKDREQLLKKAWLMNAMVKKYNKDVYTRANNSSEYTIAEEKKRVEGEEKEIASDIVNHPLIMKLSKDYIAEIEQNVVTSAQVMLSTEEYEEQVMEAYWKEIQDTEEYKELMNADADRFYTLLDEVKKKDLPEVQVLGEVWTERERFNQQFLEEYNQQYLEKLDKVIAKATEQVQKREEILKVLSNLDIEKSSNKLIGSMKIMQELLVVSDGFELNEEAMDQYKKYLEAMEKVVEITEKLYDLDENTPFDAEELKEIQSAYKEAYLCVLSLKSAFYQYNIMMDNVCEVLENNIVILGTIDKKNLVNLPKIMEDAGSVELDVTGSAFVAMEGKSNVRVPLEYTDMDGQKVEGFFTKEVTKMPALLNFRDTLEKLKKKYPAMADIATHMLEKGKLDINYVNKLNWDCHLPKDMEKLSMKKAQEKVLESMLKEYTDLEIFDDVIENNKEEAMAYFVDLIDTMAVQQNKDKVYCDGLKLPKGGIFKTDNRNITMSEVANLLEIPDVVVKARSMKIINGGAEVKGTFMEKGKGIDIAHLSKDHPMRGYKEEVYDNSQGIKSLADLQVLDYICMNIDRHPRNMLYIFDTETDPKHPKFMGVQGIDNDASFGLITEDEEIGPDIHVTKLEDLGVISKSVYDAIIQMDPDVFRLSLKKQKHSQDEIDAACKRLTKLKEKILEDQKYFSDTEPGILERGRIRVVNDEDFQKLTFDQILDASPNAKLFKNVKEQVIDKVSVTEREDVKQEYKTSENIKKITGATTKPKEIFDISEINLKNKHYYKKLHQDLAKMLLETKRVDSAIRGSSKEFKTVQKRLKESMELVGKMESPTKEEIETIDGSLKNVLESIKKYQDYKEENSSGSKYEEKRIKAISKIKRSLSTKNGALKEALKKYVERQKDTDFRKEKKEEREREEQKAQQFLNNISEWAADQPKEDWERRLVARIVTNILIEKMWAYESDRKAVKIFNMTQEQYEQQITNIINDERFQNYYQALDKEELINNFGKGKVGEVYEKEFRKIWAEPVQYTEAKEPETKNLENNEIGLVQ